MTDTLRPRGSRHVSGPVRCLHRGTSAVVNLVTPVEGNGPPYVQWCSLVGTEISCDESCVCHGAKWTAADTEAAGALSREVYEPLRQVVAQVMEQITQSPPGLPCWTDWASAFTAGVSAPQRAWHAAEEARHEAVKLEHHPRARRTMLAAEDAAWAVVHATAGNVALALEYIQSSRLLLEDAKK